MALVSMKEMMIKGKKEGYAIGQFNVNNLEYAQAILQAAEAEQSPVILGVSEGAARYMGGFTTVVNMIKGLMHDYGTTVPVAIHLDHGTSFENCKKAIDAGFSSVMIDASSKPLAENIEITNTVVEYAHSKGVSVEAELGVVGGEEDDIIADGVVYADPAECKELVDNTNIDCLAPALGSVHGPYKGEPNLGFEEMEIISKQSDLPLVLHGGTGIPLKDIQRSISLGTAKINVNTESQIQGTKAVRDFLAADTEAYDPRKFLTPMREAIKETVIGKMREFGSSQKA
ncbi:class II fructose-1,6-bisphosphate aldolase [Sporosarcina sp. G11-34]|uniref:class II fructose-1,6-bisphosphate aldolase n=1 Tax=Sporosarcina sp. G11-34 TaxID=2849605 RepID=UPI0022A9DDAE|nr:class II fructose-1,6-bisphosphate aldolase [Sporosarcina sp. G11-34]MCZ2258722.1 class II fructose-1,6-bisphosphate aldolase [Sporosarcina sp. G11-34]